jgi:thiol-disulfide isomerase/thioredoxin
MIKRSLLAAGLTFAALAGMVSTAAARGPIAFVQDDKPQDKPKGEAVNPLQAVQQDLQDGKVDEAISKLEGLSKDKPKDQQLLFGLMMVTQQKAQAMMNDRKASIPVFLKSADAAKKLRDLLGKDLKPFQAQQIGMALYNGACSLALDDKAEAAVAMLKDAFDAGFNEYDTFAKDDELNSLRKRDDFLAMVKSLEAKKVEAEKKKAEEAKGEVAKMFKDNKEFPFTFELPDLEDKTVKLDDLKGKVVIVDIWGTWCPPCRKEIPHFVDLLKEYKGKGLEIVGINYENVETPEAKKLIKSYLEENKVPYKCVIGDEKTQKLVPDFEGYPTTLFLDRTGKVRLKVVGYHEKPVLEEIIKTLLDEK